MKLETKTASRSRGEYEQSLRARGYKQIGSGAFAVVYAKPNGNQVIKVGCSGDAYLKYIQKIGLNAENPLFPRVRSLIQYKVKTRRDWAIFNDYDDDYYIAKMERLVKHTRIRAAKRQRHWRKLGLDDHEDLDQWRIGSTLKNAKVKAYVIQACKKLREVYRGKFSDLHINNVMWRRKGNTVHAVVTDPVA